MHHELDIHPIPEKVLYVNDLRLAGNPQYEMTADYEKAVTGMRKSEGGVLPDDNVRIYVPMDLNADGIIHMLYELYYTLGDVDERTEFSYRDGVQKLIYQLEIYDQVWVARGSHDEQTEVPGKLHSRQGIALAGEIVKYLEEHEGCAECFPYEEIEELRGEFGV